MASRVWFITGASKGFGRVWTEAALARGDKVAATARDPGTLADLVAKYGDAIEALKLDVTDKAEVAATVAAAHDRFGRLDIVINNAGYGLFGAIEEGTPEEYRPMFETNVFGLARMTQLVLPGMRAARCGRIVNIGSMGGRLVFPVGGYYHASKYAIEAISDALRFEVAPFGIKVSLVEPGLIRTGFGAVAARSLAETATPTGPYAALNTATDRQIAESYASRFLSADPDAVAAVIARAVTASRPRIRYVVTPVAKFLVHTRRLLGARFFDAYLRGQFRGWPSAPSIAPDSGQKVRST